MIYTVGNKNNYHAAIAEYGEITKLARHEPNEQYPDGYEGGCVFLTEYDAQDYIERNGFSHYDVFGLEADWERDTAPSSCPEYRSLLRETAIIVLHKPETVQS